MRIRVLGAGWFGAHIAAELILRGHSVEVHDTAADIFTGASGSNPARLHTGAHYPRSQLTRAACQDHNEEFLTRYGHMTSGVAVNLYAIAAHESLLDFGTYRQVLQREIEFITVYDPAEHGLINVEGAILTGERHIVIDKAREHFRQALANNLVLNAPVAPVDSADWDWTLDCTFCALDGENVARYEPCIMGLICGPTDKAVTIMDGGFGSLYPWDESHGLSSLTSASLTPFSKSCTTWGEAKALLDGISPTDGWSRCAAMMTQMANYWPSVRDLYTVVDYKLSIRAMPKSAADARLPDIVKVGERALRVRAGKIDAIFSTARDIVERIQA